MNKLDIILFIFDTCLLFNKNITTIIDLQIDNSLIIDITKFIEIESRELNVARLMIRLCDRLTIEQSLNFNDFIITLNSDNIISIN